MPKQPRPHPLNGDFQWVSCATPLRRLTRFADDPDPLDPSSDCPASRDYSKAYLHHLVKSGEILGQVLLSWHNVAFFETLMARLRTAIAAGRLEALRRAFKARATAEQDAAAGSAP